MVPLSSVLSVGSSTFGVCDFRILWISVSFGFCGVLISVFGF